MATARGSRAFDFFEAPPLPRSPWPRHPMLDECEAHSPLSLGSVGCRGSVAAAVRGPQVARAVGRVIQVPRLIAPDDAAAASAADLALGNLGGPAPAKCLVAPRIPAPWSSSSAHSPTFCSLSR